MSDTPRTDANTKDGQYKEMGCTTILQAWDYKPSEHGEVVEADFGRQLERELNAANAKIAELNARHEKVLEDFAGCAFELEKLKRKEASRDNSHDKVSRELPPDLPEPHPEMAGATVLRGPLEVEDGVVFMSWMNSQLFGWQFWDWLGKANKYYATHDASVIEANRDKIVCVIP